jgi:hypothetical protein
MPVNDLNIKTLALDWIAAWNKRDIDKIMYHYADNVIFYSPTVIKRWNSPEGKIEGKSKLKEHFLKGFELVPNLHFEYLDLLYGIDGMTIIYKRESGVLAADVVTLNDENKCILVKAYYGE